MIICYFSTEELLLALFAAVDCALEANEPLGVMPSLDFAVED